MRYCIKLTLSFSLLSLCALSFFPSVYAENVQSTVPESSLTGENSPEETSVRTTEDSVPSEAAQDGEALSNSSAILSSDPPSDVVYTEDELAAWIAQLPPQGGSVSLGASISITQKYYVFADSPVTIYTGEFGLIYNGGCLRSDFDALTISGEGVSFPVVDVCDIQASSYYYANWNNELSGPSITATGKNGVGGTALRISSVDNKAVSLNRTIRPGYIRSYGAGAIGIEFVAPVKAYCFQVEVNGAHSAAIKAPQGVSLFYSNLSATGHNSVSVRGSEILLDTCVSVPAPQNAVNRPRTLLGDSLYFPVQQYSRATQWDTPYFFIALLSGGDNYPAVYRALPVEWDMDACASIDTSVLGKTSVPGEILLGFTGMENAVPELVIDVRDPAMPCIDKVVVRDDGETECAVFPLWQDYYPEDGNVTFWKSEDKGKTWQDITWSEEVLWDTDGIFFSYTSLTHPIQFVLKVEGVGASNIVTLSAKNRLQIYGIGGDRTGIDREIAYTDEDEEQEPDEEPTTPSDKHNPDNAISQPALPTMDSQQPVTAVTQSGASPASESTYTKKIPGPAAQILIPQEKDAHLATFGDSPPPTAQPQTGLSPVITSSTNPGFSIPAAYIILLSILVLSAGGFIFLRIYQHRGHS